MTQPSNFLQMPGQQQRYRYTILVIVRRGGIICKHAAGMYFCFELACMAARRSRSQLINSNEQYIYPARTPVWTIWLPPRDTRKSIKTCGRMDGREAVPKVFDRYSPLR